jgi:hypothetical protein
MSISQTVHVDPSRSDVVVVDGVAAPILSNAKTAEMNEADEHYSPIDFSDATAVLQRMFAAVERYPSGDDCAWFHYLNDWDRRFVLNIYDMFVTTGKAPLSKKQEVKAAVILRKMMVPSWSCAAPACQAQK